MLPDGFTFYVSFCFSISLLFDKETLAKKAKKLSKRKFYQRTLTYHSGLSSSPSLASALWYQSLWPYSVAYSVQVDSHKILPDSKRKEKRSKERILITLLVIFNKFSEVTLKVWAVEVARKTTSNRKGWPNGRLVDGFSLINVSFPRKEKFFAFFAGVSLSNNKEMPKQIKT